MLTIKIVAIYYDYRINYYLINAYDESDNMDDVDNTRVFLHVMNFAFA